MNSNEVVAIWLHDYSARLFLGLHGDRPVSRWVVMGTVMDPTPIGVWINIDHIEERRRGEKDTKVLWTVKPGQCLIRWDYVITAQRLKERESPEDPRTGPGQYS